MKKKSGVIAPRGRLLKGTEAAQHLGISYRALARLVAAGKIAHLRSESGRLLGVYEADCEAWVERRRVEAESTRSRSAKYDVDAAVLALLGPDDRDHMF
jgi:excisionase family DNA binding protein